MIKSLPLSAFLLIAAVTACTDDSPRSDITRCLLEYDRNKDGSVDLRLEKYEREGQKVLTVHSRRVSADRWSKIRNYYAKGTLVTIEEDLEGDGTFETLIVVLGEPEHVEAFTRTKDGTVKVATESMRQHYQRIFRASSEYWSKALNETNAADSERLLDKYLEEINPPK